MKRLVRSALDFKNALWVFPLFLMEKVLTYHQLELQPTLVKGLSFVSQGLTAAEQRNSHSFMFLPLPHSPSSLPSFSFTGSFTILSLLFCFPFLASEAENFTGFTST